MIYSPGNKRINTDSLRILKLVSSVSWRLWANPFSMLSQDMFHDKLEIEIPREVISTVFTIYCQSNHWLSNSYPDYKTEILWLLIFTLSSIFWRKGQFYENLSVMLMICLWPRVFTPHKSFLSNWGLILLITFLKCNRFCTVLTHWPNSS